jgi:hypothetical protein
MSEVHNPILGYADSYRLMVRMAEKEGKPLVVSMWSVITDLERNMAPLMESAQSELAALREELATAKRNEHNSEVAYKAAIEKQEELREELAKSGRADHLRQRIAFLTTEIHKQAERLTAAEQRNAESSASLQLATRLLASGLSALNPRAGLAKNVRAFLDSQRNPTESGASE